MRIGKYDITADKNQFILSEVSTVKDEKSNNFGSETLTNKKFYPTMPQLIAGLQKNGTRECLRAAMSLQELEVLIKKQHEDLMLAIPF